jgi:hypothetical protein
MAWAGKEECKEHVRLLVRTASNSYFPQVVSALSIPDPTGELQERVRSVWDVVKTVTKELLPAFRQIEKVRIALEGFPDELVLQAAKAIGDDKPVTQGAIRTAEFKQFVSSKPEARGDLPPIGATFFARSVKPRDGLPSGVGRLVVAAKLREVAAQIGFTRLEPVSNADLQGEYDLGVEAAALGLTTNWLPASEVHGEGVFLELDEARVRQWESSPLVVERGRELLGARAHAVAAEGRLAPAALRARDGRHGHGPRGDHRENGRRYVGVRMNVRNRDLGSFVAEAQGKVERALHLPAGYELTWGGEFENQERAMARLELVIPLALMLTLLLLFSAFNSLFDAAIILLNVPLALLGGVVALAVVHMPLSVSAAVGFIALLGQAVLNGVLVVAAIRARLEAGEAPFDAVFNGTRERLRAVLVTALLASLGLLPAALSHAIGSETQRPIAVAVVGGTISAALLTLVVLPVTYYAACYCGSAGGSLARCARSRRSRSSRAPSGGARPRSER